MLTPEELHQLVSKLYGEVRDRLPGSSWHCLEAALICLGAARATNSGGHLAIGELRLPDGNSTWHCCYIAGDGRVIDSCNGEIRLSERAGLGLTLPMVPPPERQN